MKLKVFIGYVDMWMVWVNGFNVVVVVVCDWVGMDVYLYW